jgi:hypothetical protein
MPGQEAGSVGFAAAIIVVETVHAAVGAQRVRARCCKSKSETVSAPAA